MMARLKELWKELFMEDKKIITFGDVLELLGRYETEIILCDQAETDSLIGKADSDLWGALEERAIIGLYPESASLKVWLEDEADGAG